MRINRYFQFLKESKESKKILIITGEGFQSDEVLKPKESLESEGYKVTISSNKTGEFKAFNNDEVVTVQTELKELNPSDFDLLIIPGGKAPEYLRKKSSVINFVKEFNQTGKTIASICHGPLILVSAGLVEGKKMTCFEDAVDELKEAGAKYKNKSVVIDDNIITSRNPIDLDDFCQAIKEKLKES
jgi:protease I